MVAVFVGRKKKFKYFYNKIFIFHIFSRNAMDLKGGIWLVAPLVKNLSCSHPRYAGKFINHIGPGDTIQAFLVICLTIGVVGANLMVIFVINSRRYSSYIHPQVNHFNYFFFIANKQFIFSATLFINIISLKRFSNWPSHNSFWGVTCLVPLLALW